MSYATIDEFEMYYECHGHAGDALVLLHGFTGDVTDWRHQVEDLAREHRLLAMDHRGHGRSGAPPDRTSYTIERMAEDVLLLADCLGLERFHLVGHSMGGFIAQEIALRMPERLLSLVLEDTGPEFAIAKVEAVRRLVDSQIRTAEAEGMKALAERITLPHPPHQTPERLAEERTDRKSVV